MSNEPKPVAVPTNSEFCSRMVRQFCFKLPQLAAGTEEVYELSDEEPVPDYMQNAKTTAQNCPQFADLIVTPMQRQQYKVVEVIEALMQAVAITNDIAEESGHPRRAYGVRVQQRTYFAADPMRVKSASEVYVCRTE